jgi:hypothetical protein
MGNGIATKKIKYMPKEQPLKLFDGIEDTEGWREEWKNMPEFIQNDLEPFQSVIVHFENKKDLDKFSELVDQKITYKTKSIWYPKAEIADNINKRYIDGE